MKVVGFYVNDYKTVSDKTVQNLGMMYAKNAWLTKLLYQDKVWKICKSCN